jgi:glycosyltransferase involved in cell wall biosynthesis
MSRVSVCLLTYNRAEWLPQTVPTILSQSLADFELIVSDNCSTDGTERFFLELRAKDGRVSYYRNERNLGVTGNYQAAFERAQGDYVAFLHDNDLFDPDLLLSWHRALDRFPSAALVFNAIDSINLRDRLVARHRHPYPPLIQPGRLLLDEMLTSFGSPVFGMVMVRRRCVEQVGAFDPIRFPNIGDVDLWMRLAARFDVAYLPEPLIRARIHEKGHFTEAQWMPEESYELYRLNTIRRYCGEPQRLAAALADLDRRRDRFWCRQLFGHARRGRFRVVAEGLRACQRSSSPRLRLLGRVFGPFLT